ncbi:MAG: radical SAM protein, partial [Eubacteriaceae bacterium]|nr:radical SAM protein [Eubacteriaceae bacterium]
MKLICNVCPHNCNLDEGQTGFCRARRNVDEKIVSINYG